MADDKAPLASLPMFGVPSIDLTKINPTGVGTNPEITAEYQKMMDAQKEYADSLEQRYSQPNWFKIAAGFAKPQLGGFLASLGSANQAMGEQLEMQRAVAPTVAQMRAAISQGNIGLTQGKQAAAITEKAKQEGRLLTPTEAADVASLTSGPQKAATAGQEMATAQQAQLLQMLAEGRSYTDLVAKLPKDFVDSTIRSFAAMNPNFKMPAGMPGAAKPTESKPETPSHIPGVPANLTSALPIGQQIESQSQAVQSMQQDRDKINNVLTAQATQATPIFEAASTLYKAAANPALAPAFGVFEKGDPLSMIGTALESGSFPAVLSNMREQLIKSRLNADDKKRAMSDLQAMEGVLADLQTKMNNGVLNPTDVRTMFESASIPGLKNNQDAFLRGVARIASDALTKYETKQAFDTALKDPTFNVMTWASSPYFTQVQDNAKRRTHGLIANPAGTQAPKFMQEGLGSAYQVQPPVKTKSSPKTEDWIKEARRRGLMQ